MVNGDLTKSVTTSSIGRRCLHTRARLQVDLQGSASGVPAADSERPVEHFYRVEGSRCRGIGEVHGGQLQAKKAPLDGLWLERRLPALNDQNPA